MKTKSKDLMQLNDAQLLFIRDHLQDLKYKIDLTSKALDGLKYLKDKSNVH
jgi:hypothetical protein